jgi:hypothetical protein
LNAFGWLCLQSRLHISCAIYHSGCSVPCGIVCRTALCQCSCGVIRECQGCCAFLQCCSLRVATVTYWQQVSLCRGLAGGQYRYKSAVQLFSESHGGDSCCHKRKNTGGDGLQ